MIVWHAAKTARAFDLIQKKMEIGLGKNLSSTTQFAHISTRKFERGDYALDVIGADTNTAWVFELEISDDTILLADPCDEGGKYYGGGWMVCADSIPIVKIISVEHIPHVLTWENTALNNS